MDQEGLREITAASRDFVTLHRHGMLSTLVRESSPDKFQGYPFGSLICYDILPSAEIVVSLSQISEHCKNLRKDSRASVTIVDQYGMFDPQAHARATLLVELREVGDTHREQCAESYFRRFPKASSRELAHDFVFFSGKPSRIRWIGGFGDIGWVSGTDFCAASADPLAYEGLSILDHMNFDHYEALKEITEAYSDFDASRFRIQMCAINAQGFRLQLNSEREEESLQIPFENPAHTPDDARKEIIALLKKARGSVQ